MGRTARRTTAVLAGLATVATLATGLAIAGQTEHAQCRTMDAGTRTEPLLVRVADDTADGLCRTDPMARNELFNVTAPAFDPFGRPIDAHGVEEDGAASYVGSPWVFDPEDGGFSVPGYWRVWDVPGGTVTMVPGQGMKRCEDWTTTGAECTGREFLPLSAGS